MKNIYKTDPTITFDHMHTEEQSQTASENNRSSMVILFVIEICTVLSLLGFMFLLMK